MTMKTVCSMHNIFLRNGAATCSTSSSNSNKLNNNKESQQRADAPKLKRNLRSCEGLSSVSSSSSLKSKSKKHSSEFLSGKKGQHTYIVAQHCEHSQLANASFKKHGSSNFLKTLSHAAQSYGTDIDLRYGVDSGRLTNRDSYPSVISSSNATFGSRRQSGTGVGRHNAAFALIAAASNSGRKPKMLSSKHMVSSQKLEEFVSDKKWSKLRKYLATEDGAFSLALYVSDHGESVGSYRNSGGSLLHIACQGHPPVDIIKTLCAACPTWLYDRRNVHQHTPLHVAAAWGAHPDVITFLVNQAPECASLLDFEGRTPLHLHCQFCSETDTCDPRSFTPQEHEEYRSKMRSGELSGVEGNDTSTNNEDDYFVGGGYDDFGDFGGVSVNDIAYRNDYRTHGPIDQVVIQLHRASPTCINSEDLNGMNPIEYCLIRAVERNTVVRMQRLSVDAWHLHEAEESKQREIAKENNLRLNRIRRQMNASHSSNNMFLQMTQEATSMLHDLSPSLHGCVQEEKKADDLPETMTIRATLSQEGNKVKKSNSNMMLQLTKEGTSMLSDLVPCLQDSEVSEEDEANGGSGKLTLRGTCNEDSPRPANEGRRIMRRNSYSKTMLENAMAGTPRDEVKRSSEEMMKVTVKRQSGHMNLNATTGQRTNEENTEVQVNFSSNLSLRGRRKTTSTIDLKALAKRVKDSDQTAPLIQSELQLGIV